MKNIEIITTKDQSSSLYLPDMDETYHSRWGAKSESNHVFISNTMCKFLENQKPDKLHILEMGLGTGLNALLSYEFAEKNALKINYDSIEKYRLEKQIWEALKFDNNKVMSKIHEVVSAQKTELSSWFELTILEEDLVEMELKKQHYHVVFFDAFAPQKQPHLWTVSVFEKLYHAMKKGGILGTYAAAGFVKRNMKAAGFVLEHPAGANGKREMTIAIKK